MAGVRVWTAGGGGGRRLGADQAHGAGELFLLGEQAPRLGDDEHVEEEYEERHETTHEQLGDPRPDRPQRTAPGNRHLQPHIRYDQPH